MVIAKAENAKSKNKLLEDATVFQAAIEKLAVLVGISGKKGARFGASAIRTGNTPTFTKPADLKGNATSYKEKMIFDYEKNSSLKIRTIGRQSTATSSVSYSQSATKGCSSDLKTKTGSTMRRPALWPPKMGLPFCAWSNQFAIVKMNPR